MINTMPIPRKINLGVRSISQVYTEADRIPAARMPMLFGNRVASGSETGWFRFIFDIGGSIFILFLLIKIFYILGNMGKIIRK